MIEMQRKIGIGMATFLFGASVAIPTALAASISSKADNSGNPLSVTSGRYGLIATTIAPPTAPTATALSLTALTGTGAGRRKVFWLVNNGTVNLSAASWTFTGTGITASRTLNISACVGATWNIAAGTCAGTTISVVNYTGNGPTTTTISTAPALNSIPLVAGTNTSMKATYGSTGGTGTVALTTTNTGPGQVRAATTSAS